jgi:hypothetical protein
VDRKGEFSQSGKGQVHFGCVKGRFGVLGNLRALSCGKRTPKFEIFAADKKMEEYPMKDTAP